MNKEFELGKVLMANQLMIEWFNDHPQAQADVKDYMLSTMPKSDLDEMFGTEPKAINKEDDDEWMEDDR